MTLRLTFLGTGTSAGVPMIGCHCDVCESDDPRDRRSRPSVLVSYDDPAAPPADDAPATRQFLVDTAPELRDQCIRHTVDRIDGVFYTHAHADHIFGLDDLRRFNAVQGEEVNLYAESTVHEKFQRIFRYIFNPNRSVPESFIPKLAPLTIEPNVRLDLYGAAWTPMRLMHGRLPIVGYRVESGGRSLAYCTDVSAIPPESYALLENLDVLVIDALRYRHHPTHFTVDQALAQIDQIRPRQAYLTHIAHDIQHADLEIRLPDGISIAYDGLEVTLDTTAPLKPGLSEGPDQVTH